MTNTPKLAEDVERRLKSWSEDPDGGLCADFTTEGYGYYDELKQFLAQELATFKTQVRKEIEELKYNSSRGETSFHEFCYDQAISDCLSIPSLKEE